MPSIRSTLGPISLASRAPEIIAYTHEEHTVGSWLSRRGRFEGLLVYPPPGGREERFHLFIRSLVEDVVECSHCPEDFWSVQTD